MQRCILRVSLCHRYRLGLSKGQKCIPGTHLFIYHPCCGIHVDRKLQSTKENKTKPQVKNYQRKTFKQSHTTRKPELLSLNHEMLQSKKQRSRSGIEDKRHCSFALYRLDDVDPIHYSLIYNNIKETEAFGQVRFGVTNVMGRICMCWMFVNIAVVSLVNLHVIPQHLQMMLFPAFGLYVLGFWRFLKVRKWYRETVFRLYRENHGINKKYIMIKPYMFIYSRQKHFSESNLKKLDPEKYPERFKLDWRKYHLEPDHFTHETFLGDILGQKCKEEKN